MKGNLMVFPYNGKSNAPTWCHYTKLNPKWVTSCSHCQKGSRRHHKHWRLLPMVFVVLHNMMLRPYCWRYHLLMSANMEKYSAQLEASPLLTSSHDTGRLYMLPCYTCYQRIKVIINLIQQWTLQGITATCLQDILKQQWHKYYGSNQPLFSWI